MKKTTILALTICALALLSPLIFNDLWIWLVSAAGAIGAWLLVNATVICIGGACWPLAGWIVATAAGAVLGLKAWVIRAWLKYRNHSKK